MRKSVIVTLCLLVALAQPCWGQFIRVPVVRVPIVRPPIVHVPHIPHVPGRSGAGGHAQNGQAQKENEWPWGEILAWIGGGLLAIGGTIGAVVLIRKWRTRAIPRALVRIHSLPPGEAPEWVRSAWIGLELPLIVGQVRPEHGPAQQAVSRLEVIVPDGYAVDGKAALEILESASADAGKWWRDNAPDVLTPGSQLVFPSYVCERLDDLAPAK